MNEKQKEYLLVLAFLYLRYRKFEKALVVLLILKRFFPGDAHILLSRAYAYLSMRVFQAALQESEETLACATREDHIAYAHFIKAHALYGLGREREGREVFNYFLNYQKAVAELNEEQKEIDAPIAS